MIDYGFDVGDSVYHVKDIGGEIGFVTALDRDFDHGDITTCRIVWNVASYQKALLVPIADQDIQWTNKIVKT